MKVIVRFSYLLLYIVIVAGCFTKPSVETAQEYNDKLIEIQQQLVETDRKLDNDFYLNYYDYYLPNDKEYKTFAQQFKDQFKSIDNKLQQIKPLNGYEGFYNAMKQYSKFMNNSIDSFYTTLMKIDRAEVEKAKTMVLQYNEKRETIETQIFSAQNRLASDYGFSFKQQY